MYKNIIVIPPCMSYGDASSIIGMIYFLLEYYENVYFNLDPCLENYFHSFFSNDKLFNKRIFITNNPAYLIANGNYGEYHICNVFTGDWKGANKLYMELPKIDKDFYFNDMNPLYNKLIIPPELLCNPNKHLPSLNMEINHLFYYELVGLNNNVRMDYFNYIRNITEETQIKHNILHKYQISVDEKYNIINDSVGMYNEIGSLIKNNHKTINIHNLAPHAGKLSKLVEDAAEVHFIEGSNVNFFYHMNYKNIVKLNTIYFHVWVRNRCWPDPFMNLDYAWKTVTTPKLNNWVFLFDKNIKEI